MKVKRKVKIRVTIFAGILLLLCFCGEITNASSGNITITLSEGMDSKILYLKVATMVNGEWKLNETFEKSQVNLNEIKNGTQLTEAAGKLELYAYENQIEMDACENNDLNNRVYLESLEEGLYLMVMEENDSVTMSPALVSLPGWTGEEMSYDVTMIPKITEKNIAPKTGWNSSEGLYAGVAGTAFAIIVLWFYYKRRDYSK